MAPKNSKNARLLIATAGAGPYTIVTRTHGLKLGLDPDWTEASAHGMTFKDYVKGMMDWAGTVLQYYDTVFALLEGASINGTSYYFLAYYDYPADPTNYWRGQCTFGFGEVNMDLGVTIDNTFSMRIYNGDVALVRNGTVYS